ncbi:choice-of-anchor W domain-containing protein [Cyanobium sp. ULC082]
MVFSPRALAVVVTNPSTLDDVGFNCLKGTGAGCTPATIEENWVVEGDGRAVPNAFTRINEWTSNTAFTPRDQQDQLWPYNTTVPFSVVYTKASQGVVFSLDFGGSIGTKVSSFAPLTRSPAIDSLYIRVASGSNSTFFITSLTNLSLSTSQGTTSIGSITANGLASGREVKYAVVRDLPDSDFTITGNAFFNGPTSPTPLRGGNWQIKAAYTNTVPGPLPILGGLAAFGWSRQLRRRVRHQQSACSASGS